MRDDFVIYQKAPGGQMLVFPSRRLVLPGAEISKTWGIMIFFLIFFVGCILLIKYKFFQVHLFESILKHVCQTTCQVFHQSHSLKRF